MHPAGSDRKESSWGAWDARSARSGAGKHTEPVPAARGTAMAHRDRIRQSTRMATSTGTLGGIPIRQEPTGPKPRKGPSHARRTTDYETRRPDPGIARPQRDRAENPVNTTRTCNKLPSVYRYTDEVT